MEADSDQFGRGGSSAPESSGFSPAPLTHYFVASGPSSMPTRRWGTAGAAARRSPSPGSARKAQHGAGVSYYPSGGAGQNISKASPAQVAAEATADSTLVLNVLPGDPFLAFYCIL